MRLLAVLAVLASSLARADTSADVTKAFTALVDSLATDKPAVAGIEALLPLELAETPLPSNYRDLHLFEKPKTKMLRVVTGKKSAWVAAEIATRVVHDGKRVDQTVRASAFLVLDGTSWRVRAADFSAPVPDVKAPPNCGNANNQWSAEPKVPKALAPTVRALAAAVGDPDKLVAMISDDKSALVFGSAPKETFSGGAAIKAVLKKWKISAAVYGDKDDQLTAIAGGDGELAWVIAPIMAPSQLCTMYRGFFVLAKESAGWKIVHQHYSSPFD
jgi:ketosteroid isomerase-like protein